MKITFCGAARTVTGSSYLVETDSARFLVDCGMFQGTREEREKNRHDFFYNPGAIDFLLLTHAHIDHSGLIPRLYQQGFHGRVITTKASADLCGIMLPDSGHIQEMDVEWRNRKRARVGEPLEEPLYTAAEATACLQYFSPMGYGELNNVAPGITVRFTDAGHILGSASIEVWVEEKGEMTKLVFSGDIGQKNQPIIRDPDTIRDADVVLVESTYGTRLHEERETRVGKLQEIIGQSLSQGGNLVIPAFAVERTQDLLFYIDKLQKEKKIPVLPIYVDSPMAVSATEIFRQHQECFDEETWTLFKNGESPFDLPNMTFVRTTEESKALNDSAKGSIIISASGMCESGRILHHLKHNLWRPESHVLFVGYQAEGTLGRRLLDGAKSVKLFGEEVTVQAHIHNIDGFSAHADQAGLLQWLDAFQEKPKRIILVHGEESTMEEWASVVKEKTGVTPLVPEWGESYDLSETVQVPEPVCVAPPVTDSKRALMQSLRNLESDFLDFRGRIRQQLDSMEPGTVDKLSEMLKELQSRFHKTG